MDRVLPSSSVKRRNIQTVSMQFPTHPLRLALTLGFLGSAAASRADDVPTWKDVTPRGLASGANTNIISLDYGNGTFVAMGISFDLATGKGFDVSFTSKDGSAWTEHMLDFPTTGKIRFANGKFFVFGSAPTQKIFSSADGATWASVPDPDSEGYLAGLATGNGVTVAARAPGLSGALVDVTTDGANFQGVALPPASPFDGIQDIAFGAGLFTVVSAGTSLPHLFTSPDGHAWSAQSGLDNGNGYLYVAYGNGTFLAQENGISQKVSADGINWTTASPGFLKDIPGAGVYNVSTRFGRFLNGQFIAVGGGGFGFGLQASPDAQHWTSFGEVASSSDYIRDLAFGGGHYVAICPKNIFVTGTGGTEPPPMAKTADLSVAFSGTKVGPNARGTRLKFKGTLTVGNSGKKPAADVQVAAYLSDDQTFSAAGDRFVSMVSLSDLGFPTLARKGGTTGPLAVVFSGKTGGLGATSGKYLLIVADPQGVINDGDRSNNVAVYGPLP